MLVELSVVEQRYQAVMEILQDGLKVTEVAERYGVPVRSSIAGSVATNRAAFNGLADRNHRPRSCAHQISSEVEAAICELRRLHRDWGPCTLLDKLDKRGVAPLPSRSSIYRALVRNNLIEPKRRQRAQGRHGGWTITSASAPSHSWWREPPVGRCATPSSKVCGSTAFPTRC